MRNFWILALAITICYMGRNLIIELMHPSRDIMDPVAEVVVKTEDKKETAANPSKPQKASKRPAKTAQIAKAEVKHTPSPATPKPAKQAQKPQKSPKPATVAKEPVKETPRPAASKPAKQTEKKATKKSVAYPEDDIIAALAYVENFHSEAYFDGARWTIGYGSTAYADGTKVEEGQKISLLDARACTVEYLNKHVYPCIEKYVKRKLSPAETIGTCMFIYNIGAGNFATSDFLQALNDGLDKEECARRMTQFTKSAGKEAPGLLKREWVQGAVFCGYITPDDLLELTPGSVYSYGVGEFYNGISRSWDGYYNPKFSDETVRQFLEENRGSEGHQVIDIV